MNINKVVGLASGIGVAMISGTASEAPVPVFDNEFIVNMKAASTSGLDIQLFEENTGKPSHLIWEQTFPHREASNVAIVANSIRIAANNTELALQAQTASLAHTKTAEAITVLEEANGPLRQLLRAFASDAKYSKEHLDNYSLNDIIVTMRELEEKVATAHQADTNTYQPLRKALAQTRSLAVRTQQMIDQRIIIPEVFEGRASSEGLKALADMATERLAQQAG